MRCPMPRKVRDENEIRATADELPTEPPKEFVERIKAKQKSAKLVKSMKQKFRNYMHRSENSLLKMSG